MKASESSKNKAQAYYLAWLSISLFYFYQYILRISPGIMIVELRQDFKLTAEEFSSLGAIYLYAYSLLQIPIGFILDRVGVRRVICASILLCLSGTALFALAETIWVLQVARFLVGIGSAPAFICALKIVSDNLPSKDHGLLMGATLAIGTVGALLSGRFMVVLLETVGWRNSLWLAAALGGLILLIVLFLVPSSQKSTTFTSRDALTHLKRDLPIIFRQKEILIYSVIAISLYTPLCVLADLWGTAFLMEKFKLARADAVQITLCMYAGLTLGSLLLPWISLKKNILKETIQICAIGLIVALFTLLYANSLSILQLAILLTSVGFFCGAEMICFAGAAQHTVASRSGLVLGVVNTLNMLGGALIQHVIGWYLDFQWHGDYGLDGARAYSAVELVHAFSLLPFVIFLCFILCTKLTKRAPVTAA